MENLLRSWAPRQPSARLEQELFGTAAAPDPKRVVWPFQIRWQGAWGAALAMCVVALFTVANVSHLSRLSTNEVPLTLASLSNVTSLAMGQHNTWSAPIFSWTNDGELRSTIRPFDLLTTNRLLR